MATETATIEITIDLENNVFIYYVKKYALAERTAIAAAVPMKFKKVRTVQQALTSHFWVHDIQRNLSLAEIEQYLQLWEVIDSFQLQNSNDQHVWNFSSNGLYTSKSAYRAFFIGAESFEPWKRIWKSWAAPKCKVFVWLAINNKCWTADRLKKRGLDHPENCVLCDQEDETVQHILSNCVFTRQFWHNILTPIGLSSVGPKRRDLVFTEWGRKASTMIPKSKRKGFNSMVILGAWSIWKQRNRCVFEGARPCLNTLEDGFKDEMRLWVSAGAKNLRSLFDPG